MNVTHNLYPVRSVAPSGKVEVGVGVLYSRDSNEDGEGGDNVGEEDIDDDLIETYSVFRLRLLTLIGW